MKPLFWFRVLKGVMCAIALTLTVLGVFAFIGIRSSDPQKHLELYANVALILGVTFGAGMAARGADSTLITALVCGTACALIMLVISICFSKFGASSLLRIVFTIAASLLGGGLMNDSGGRSIKKQSIKRRRAIAKKYGG